MQIAQPYALNEQGTRPNNEDAIYPLKYGATPANHFFIVCDGMGGHENGEVATHSVCNSFATFLRELPPDEFDETVFDRALHVAFDALDQKDNPNETGKKMGTTLAFLYLNSKQAFIAYIGDSRIYHLRKNDHGQVSILFQSTDHSLINELLKAEAITEEEAANHPKKNIITRAMQPHLERRCKADKYITGDIAAGDRFFLCSDGVLESLTNQQLCTIAAEHDQDKTLINAIQQLCEAHSHDNFSAWLISIIKP